MPGRRLGTAKGGERARPGRVLVFFGHFDEHIQSSNKFPFIENRVLQGRASGGYYVS